MANGEQRASKGAVLAVPACEPGRGGGHLARCMVLVCDLRTLGREARLFLSNTAHANNLLDAAQFECNWLIAEDLLSKIKWECIILDRFQTPPEELARWEKLAPVIGIDEGGPHRKYFDFLIDILPNCNRIKPNIADPSLLPVMPGKDLPQRARSFTEEEEGEDKRKIKILVSFGQEDSAGLGSVAIKALSAQNPKNTEITLLQGDLSTPYSPLSTPHSPKIINAIPNLNEHLNEYDLLITHYGLTAFEALYAGVAVVLVSPGAYHEKLAKSAGFCTAGIGKHGAVKLARLLFKKSAINYPFFNNLKNRYAALAVKHHLDKPPQHSLAELINGFTPDVSRNCPVCGAARHSPAIARFSERSYHRCTHCGIISMNRLTLPPIEYGKKYFFEAYQQQYGKTYLEDFPHLTDMGKRRLAVINNLLKIYKPRSAPTNTNKNSAAPSLLDIGCAYGPFLTAAKEEGFSPHGIDPAEDAVNYVTHTLGIPAVQGFFPDCRLSDSPTQYDTVTLWYVIEHFRDCIPVFAEIRKLLKPGGVLAFATPSFSGISGRSSLKCFLKHSPADHWTIWSPTAAQKALKMAGFTVKKIVNSGHHPKRFPLLGKYAQSVKKPLYRLLLALSKIFSLSDTFEVYAVK